MNDTGRRALLKGRRAAVLLAALWLALYAPLEAGGETVSRVFTPSGQLTPGRADRDYWTTPMDIHDEEAVWQMLMAPSYVLSGGQQEQVTLYARPDEKSDAVGEVTCQSQGVQVLKEDENGWTLVRCYSSSFHDSKTEKWNELVEGYVPTDRLRRQTPAAGMGLVVDKLTQRLYVFREGKLFSTLRVSTGLSNERQPYNETRSGEFFLVSKVGDFKSDNMTCEIAIRFNAGDLIHQVPYIGADKDYDLCEGKLGQRASHGCVRVQRKRTPEGVNMRWIWNNYEKWTKIVIWEDLEGRTLEETDGETLVYYNPKKGRYYHLKETCYGVREEYLPLTPIPYASLYETHTKLKECPYCNPPSKR